MSHFCPAYPKPRASKATRWWMFLSARSSWLDSLYERSYRMKMGEVKLPTRLYMVNEPALVRRVLVDQAENYPKHSLLADALRPLLGDSIFTTNGQAWQRQRRMMDPAFEQARVQVAFAGMAQATRAMTERLDRLADGAQHDIELEMTHVTADIIMRTILSTPISAGDAGRVFEAFARFQELAPRLMLPAIFGLRWLTPFWCARASRRAAAEIRGLLAAIIRPRFEAQRAGCHESGRDILEALLEARDADGRPMEFEEVLDQVAMLFLAGHETSASALTWALYLLACDPAAQLRVAHEARANTGPGDIELSQLRDLSFTRQVFREALRLFPPVGFFARQAAACDAMRDKHIEPGASVVVAPWLLHRHRELWDEPDAFDPDRFATDAGRESARQAYLPFGMGPRVCIGANFAQQEAALVLATLLRRYRFEPVAGHVPQPVGRLTIRSANGVPLHVFKRDVGQERT